MNIRPIRNDIDHAAAVRELKQVWNAAPGTPGADLRAVLGILIDAYEREQYPTEPMHPIEFLKIAMEDQGRTQAELGAVLGSRSRASEILALQRRLTLPMILAIKRAWGLPVDALTAPYELVAAPLTKRPAQSATQAASAGRFAKGGGMTKGAAAKPAAAPKKVRVMERQSVARTRSFKKETV